MDWEGGGNLVVIEINNIDSMEYMSKPIRFSVNREQPYCPESVFHLGPPCKTITCGRNMSSRLPSMTKTEDTLKALSILSIKEKGCKQQDLSVSKYP